LLTAFIKSPNSLIYSSNITSEAALRKPRF
jgi:hypothetical protein